ncbi:hypothetical protein Y032_0012g1702 [Ancylostoma ceylanicum]|nr:hypothetical protein Y032_0012g1702 [Ancylostoma ceylanicum]
MGRGCTTGCAADAPVAEESRDGSNSTISVHRRPEEEELRKRDNLPWVPFILFVRHFDATNKQTVKPSILRKVRFCCWDEVSGIFDDDRLLNI